MGHVPKKSAISEWSKKELYQMLMHSKENFINKIQRTVDGRGGIRNNKGEMIVSKSLNQYTKKNFNQDMSTRTFRR